jgi:hypothetical protein
MIASEIRTLWTGAAAATTGTGCLLTRPCRTHAVEISWVVTGTNNDKAITALVVAFEGSLTGTTFQAVDTAITLSAPELTAKYALRFIVDKPVAYIKADPTTVTISGTTGTVTLTIKILSVT